MPAGTITANGRNTTQPTPAPARWGRLGTQLDAPMTAAEAMTAAGLDFEVRLAPIHTATGTPIPGKKAVLRLDNHHVLGIVSNGYSPIQNRQCFSFMDSLVTEGAVRYETVGCLDGGARVWLLARLPAHIRVKGSDDEIRKYLLLANSHDGSSALRCLFTSIRVCCANTLNAALRQGAGEGIAIRHRGDLAAKVREARQVLGLAQAYFDDLAGQIERAASFYPTHAQLDAYFKAIYPDPEDRHAARAQNVRTELTRLFEEGAGADIPQVRHTLWAGYNAVSEWIDHHRPTRGRDDADRAENRLASSLFGTGARLKARAFDLAHDMAAHGGTITTPTPAHE